MAMATQLIGFREDTPFTSVVDKTEEMRAMPEMAPVLEQLPPDTRVYNMIGRAHVGVPLMVKTKSNRYAAYGVVRDPEDKNALYVYTSPLVSYMFGTYMRRHVIPEIVRPTGRYYHYFLKRVVSPLRKSNPGFVPPPRPSVERIRIGGGDFGPIAVLDLPNNGQAIDILMRLQCLLRHMIWVLEEQREDVRAALLDLGERARHPTLAPTVVDPGNVEMTIYNLINNLKAVRDRFTLTEKVLNDVYIAQASAWNVFDYHLPAHWHYNSIALVLRDTADSRSRFFDRNLFIPAFLHELAHAMESAFMARRGAPSHAESHDFRFYGTLEALWMAAMATALISPVLVDHAMATDGYDLDVEFRVHMNEDAYTVQFEGEPGRVGPTDPILHANNPSPLFSRPIDELLAKSPSELRRAAILREQGPAAAAYRDYYWPNPQPLAEIKSQPADYEARPGVISYRELQQKTRDYIEFGLLAEADAEARVHNKQ